MTDYHDLKRSPLLEQRRALRRAGTDAEALLWRCLRDRQVGGVKFRRQHEYGPYILDFYCHERKLVIEVDGGQHAAPKNAAEDAARTLYLESHGLRVLRFTNLEVLQETDAVLARVLDEIEKNSSKNPSP